MSLNERINADLKTAMLARDSFAVETLRGAKAVILNEEVAKGLRETGLEDTVIEQLLAREVKKRDEAAGFFVQGGNQESADKELKQAEILKNYLPTQLSEAEVQILVDEAIETIKPVGAADMGKVIGAVRAKTGNSADGAMIARLVKTSLQ